jgi:DNA-binding transcriptional MerR regulator
MDDIQISMPDTHLLKRKDIAKMFGIRSRSIYHWEKKGILKPVLYLNGRPRYSVADVQKIATDRQTVDFTSKKAKA